MAEGIIVYNGVRYRAEDARRLGITQTDGKVITSRSRERTTNAPSNVAGATASGAVLSTDLSTGGQVPAGEVPAGNASKDEWHAYALAQGHTEESLDGLGRDAIRDLAATPADDGDK